MYEAYWGLTSRPFEQVPEDRFYYPSETHQGALLKLRYAIENRRGAALLAGPAGLGKTYLIQQLVRQLPESCRPVVQLVFPQMPADQLIAYLAEELAGSSSQPSTIQQNVRRIHQTLLGNARDGQHAVLIIDEAQLLRDLEVLDTVRLLLNLNDDGRPLWTMLLVGQPALLSTLQRVPELDDRLDVKCLLPRFTLEQTMAYISHRLHVAGASGPVFLSDAMETLHNTCQGIPRRINRVADLALLVGFAEELSVLGAAQIESVAEELLVGMTEG